MSEKKKSAPNTDPAQKATDQAQQAQQEGQNPDAVYAIRCQYMKDFSFENPQAPFSIEKHLPPPKVEIALDVLQRRLDNGDYEVLIKAQAKGSDEDNKDDVRFIVEVSYGGIIRFLREVDKDTVTAVLYLDAPRVMFPFLRNIIAEATMAGGFPPLLLQPVDFLALHRNKIAAVQAAEQAAKQNGASPSKDDTHDDG